jgi:hypothetical protein
MRTGESTTLYNPPISTVVDPYYPSTRFAESRLDDGRFGDHEGLYIHSLSAVSLQLIGFLPRDTQIFNLRTSVTSEGNHDDLSSQKKK